MLTLVTLLFACAADAEQPASPPAEVIEGKQVEPFEMKGWKATVFNAQRQRTVGEYQSPDYPRLLVLHVKLETDASFKASEHFVLIDESGKEYPVSPACMTALDSVPQSAILIQKGRSRLCFEVPGDDTHEHLWVVARSAEKHVKIKL